MGLDCDLIQLWLLNELTHDECVLSDLIFDPNNEARRCGYWEFPRREEIAQCAAQARIDALNIYLRQGWIDVYSCSWLSNKRFNPHGVLPDEYNFHDPEFLTQHAAVLTLRGHAKWENAFEPDWRPILDYT